MGKLFIYLFILFIYFLSFLLDLHGNVAIIKSLQISLLNDTKLRSLT